MTEHPKCPVHGVEMVSVAAGMYACTQCYPSSSGKLIALVRALVLAIDRLGLSVSQAMAVIENSYPPVEFSMSCDIADELHQWGPKERVVEYCDRLLDMKDFVQDLPYEPRGDQRAWVRRNQPPRGPRRG
jgi:hypothetical protein